MSLQAPIPGDILPVRDSRSIAKNAADPSKQVRFDLSGLDPSETAIITVDGNVDLSAGGGTFQPLDATLSALAGLTIADNVLLVGTGPDAFETVTLSAAIDTLIRAADAAAARTAIGAVGQAEIDAAIRGLDWKASVRAASTANVTLATDVDNGKTLDGVTLATGDRILLKNQSAGAENGIYVVAASGAPTRASDADADAEVTAGLSVTVTEGTTNGDTTWVLTTNDPITVGTTALTFTQLGAGVSDGSVTNAKLADMAQATIKGRASGAGTGVPTDLTGAQVRAVIGYPARTVISFASGSPDLDWSLNDKFEITLTGNATFTFSNLVTDKLIMLRIIQGIGGFHVITWPGGAITWLTGDGLPPTLSDNTGSQDVVGFWNLGGLILGFIVGLEEVA